MMNPCICKTFIYFYFKNSSRLRKPPISYSVTLLFSSSSSSPRRTKTKVSVADYLINQHSFSSEAALKASSVRTYLKNPENWDSVLSFLKERGFSNTHLKKIIEKAPFVLSSKLEYTIKPKIKIFQELGFSSTDIVDIVAADPRILTRSADNQLGPSLLALKSVLGSNAAVSKILKRSGWFLKCDLEKTMMPNIVFLKSCGISISQIITYVFNFPRFFLHKPDNMKDFVKRVDEMGFDRKSRMFLPAIRAIGSMRIATWERKLKLFNSLGYSEDHLLSVFRSTPQAFAISERKIEEVTEILLSKGNVDISFIVKNPSLLLCSVENRLKPRLRVFDILKRKNLLQKETSLVTICMTSKKLFLEKYVLPYSDELGELPLLVRGHS